jgi:hypothetical protein
MHYKFNFSSPPFVKSPHFKEDFRWTRAAANHITLKNQVK